MARKRKTTQHSTATQNHIGFIDNLDYAEIRNTRGRPYTLYYSKTGAIVGIEYKGRCMHIKDDRKKPNSQTYLLITQTVRRWQMRVGR